MNKKQLRTQNESLFAEIERSSTETKGLQIRLEELGNALDKTTEQVQALERKIRQLTEENDALRAEKEALQRELETVQKETEEPATREEPLDLQETDGFFESDTKQEDVEPDRAQESLPQANDSSFDSAALRQLGAEAIGKVTQAAARAVAAIQISGREDAEQRKNMALGKNESFKMDVLSWLSANPDDTGFRAKLEAEMQNAVSYLQQLIGE